MLILYGLILLLCKVSLIFPQDAELDSIRRIPYCLPYCHHHHAFVLPFFTSMTTENDVLKFKYMLMNEIEACSAQQLRFALSIYLPPSKSWLRCCGLENCFKEVMGLRLNSLKLNISLIGNLDANDQADVYNVAIDTMEEASYTPSSSIRLFIDYVVYNFRDGEYEFSEIFSVTTVSIPAVELNEGLPLFPNLTLYSLREYSDMMEPADNGICSLETTVKLCPRINGTTQNPNNQTTVNLRIFMGFGNLTDEHFRMLLTGVYYLLSEPLMRQNIGRIIISGPQGVLLGACFWVDIQSCVLQMSSRNKKDIFVATKAISKDDLEFSPEILNYMRNEALRKRTLTNTFVLIVTDFVSLEFLENQFFFTRAMEKQKIGLSIALVLKWNGLDERTIQKYYGNITNDVISLDSVVELKRIRKRIVDISEGLTTTTSTVAPTTTTKIPSTTYHKTKKVQTTTPTTLPLSSPSSSKTTTTTTATTYLPPTSTVSTVISTSSPASTAFEGSTLSTQMVTTTKTSTKSDISTTESSHITTSSQYSLDSSTSASLLSTSSPVHDDNIIIALSLQPSVDENDINNIKSYLTTTASECATPDRQVAIQTNSQNPTVFCDSPSCVTNQISKLSIDDVTGIDQTVEEIQNVLSHLNPIADEAEILPSLFLLTDFISKTLIYDYEEVSDFRKQLSSVDFQIIVINENEIGNATSSFPKKNLHTVTSFESLTKSKNFFCSVKHSFHLSAGEIAGIACGAVILLIVVAFIVYKGWNYVSHLQWQNKFLRLERRSMKENEYMSKGGLSNKSFKGSELSVHSLLSTNHDPWEMSRQQMTLETEIGRGSCGIVYRGSLLGRAPCEYIHRGNFFAYQFDNATVAIKIQTHASDDRSRKQLLNEIEIMKVIRPHPNIANMLGCVTLYNPICIVMEYAHGGSLKEYMMGRKIEQYLTASDVDAKVTCRRDVLSFLWQICDGMIYIHKCGVIHRDLAARNILLEGKRNVLISDFGLAIWKTDLKKSHMSNRLPIKWTALECLTREQFSEASDVWSFAVCAWEILSSGADPHRQIPNTEIIPYINSGNNLEQPYACDEQVWSLLMECWHRDPALRPTFTVLKKCLSLQLDELSKSYGYLDLNSLKQ